MSVANKTINTRIAELDTLVDWFNSEEFELEEAIDKFKEAEKLAGDIEHDLASLKNEITVLKRKFDEAL